MWKTAAQLSASARFGHSTFHRSLLPAVARRASRARQLAAVEGWILLHRCAAHRRPVLGHLMTIAAMIVTPRCSTAPFSPLPHPFHARRGWLSAAVPDPSASALWHALDRDPDFRCHLCLAGAELARRIDQHLCLDARRHYRADRALRLGTSPQTTRSAASVPNPGGNLDLST